MSFPIGPIIDLGLKLLPFLKRKPKRCLLVVEDNRGDADYAELVITRLGWQCDIVTSAEAAYPLLLSKRHSVVLLDVRLPWETGPHLAARSVKAAPWVHIVMTPTQVEDMDGLPSSVYFGIIVKPVTEESLKHIFVKPRK